MSLQGLAALLQRIPLPAPVSVLIEVAVQLRAGDSLRDRTDALRRAIEAEFNADRRGVAIALEFIPAAPPARQLKQPTAEQVEVLAARLKCEPEAFDRWLRQPTLETLDEMCERLATSYLVEDLNPPDEPVVRVVRVGETYRGPLGPVPPGPGNTINPTPTIRPRMIAGPDSRGPLGLD